MKIALVSVLLSFGFVLSACDNAVPPLQQEREDCTRQFPADAVVCPSKDGVGDTFCRGNGKGYCVCGKLANGTEGSACTP